MLLEAVKFIKGSDDLVEGPGAPFGGPFNGRDLDGEFFSAKTDFALDWFSERPLLYQHGLDAETDIAPVGRVKSWEIKADVGLWTRAQLDRSSDYFEAIKELIDDGKLFFSSGAISHLVRTEKSGEIRRWPWVELSLTPTPSNLLATVGMAKAQKHFKMAGLDALVSVLDASADALASTPLAGVKTPGAKDMGVPDGSYEALIQDLSQAFRSQQMVDDQRGYACVVSTFSDHFIASLWIDGGDESAYFDVPYLRTAEGTVLLGTAQPVEPVTEFVPIKGHGLPFEGHVERVASALATDRASVRELLSRVRSGSEQRAAKEGRAINESRRTRMAGVRDALRSGADEIDALLTETAPPEKAAEGLALFADYQRTIARLQGVLV